MDTKTNGWKVLRQNRVFTQSRNLSPQNTWITKGKTVTTQWEIQWTALYPMIQVNVIDCLKPPDKRSKL